MSVPMDNGKPNISMLAAQYMAARGMPSNAQNMSRALAIVSQQLQDSPQASAPSHAPRSQGQARMPVPPAPPQQPPVASAAASGPSIPQPAPSPSASLPQADQSNDWISKLMQVILGGGAGAMVGAGASNTSPAFNGVEAMGNMPMPPTGRMMDVPGASIGGPGIQGQLPAPPMSPMQLGNTPQLSGPQAQASQQPQLGGRPGAPQLPAPGERPAIPMPNGASGPTIELPTSGLSGMGEALPGAVKPMPEGMGSGINWSKVLGELGPLLKRLH